MKIQSDYYTIIVFDDLMYIKLFLSWDERVFSEYLKNTNSIISNAYTGKKWCVVSDAREWGLSTPELRELGKRRIVESPCKPNHIARIVGDSELKKWTLQNSYASNSQIENKFFSTIQESLEWLGALGYTIPPIHKFDE